MLMGKNDCNDDENGEKGQIDAEKKMMMKSIFSDVFSAQQHLARTASCALMSFWETAVGLWFINVEEGATQNVPN